METSLKTHKINHWGCVSFQHLNTFPVRSKGRIPLNCTGAIAMIFPYFTKKAGEGNLSAYCSVEDYHEVVGMQLKSICQELKIKYPENSFEPFVDASPIDEVDLCVKAGLGVKGTNGLLITPWYGSFVFIGEILTDLPLKTQLCKDLACFQCGACVKACPGGAINEKGVDKSRCASFISQKKGELTPEEVETLKKSGCVFGCDICQKVCPHNKAIMACDTAAEENLFTQNILNTISLDTVETVYKNRAFGFRGLKVLERNLEIIEENK